ncbi:MAG: histidine kinase dimerization/phospho-acceptor domain-containing protein [Patescibacteria group bacterium]
MILVVEPIYDRRPEYSTILKELAEEYSLVWSFEDLKKWLMDPSERVDLVIGQLEIEADGSTVVLPDVVRKLRPEAAFLAVTHESVPHGNTAMLSTASEDFPKLLKLAVKRALTNRLVRAIIARVCHEVNNPATAILGTAELAKEVHDHEVPEPVRKSLVTIMDQALRIGRVTQALNHLNPEDMEIIYEGAVPMISFPKV